MNALATQGMHSLLIVPSVASDCAWSFSFAVDVMVAECTQASDCDSFICENSLCASCEIDTSV